MPSDKERLIRVVIGVISASRQDFRSLVGMRSEAHEESDELMIALRTSSVVAREKEGRGKGGDGGMVLGTVRVEGNFEQSVEILSSKNLRNEAARMDGDEKEGKDGGIVRESKEFNVDQSLRGWNLFSEIRER